MNEQIKEMMLRAGTDTSGKWMSIDHAEKFAELIISECIWRLMVLKQEAIDNNWHVDETMSVAITDIAEHFGVEE
jgi:hypothetical protein